MTQPGLVPACALTHSAHLTGISCAVSRTKVERISNVEKKEKSSRPLSDYIPYIYLLTLRMFAHVTEYVNVQAVKKHTWLGMISSRTS